MKTFFLEKFRDAILEKKAIMRILGGKTTCAWSDGVGGTTSCSGAGHCSVAHGSNGTRCLSCASGEIGSCREPVVNGGAGGVSTN